MASGLLIKYKDPKREELYRPFSFQSVLREYWWPVAKELNLFHLPMIEWNTIKEPKDLEDLIEEVLTVQKYIKENEYGEKETREYIDMRVGQILPELKNALKEWEQIEKLFFC